MLKNFLQRRAQDLTLSLITKPSKADIIFSVIITLIYAAIALPVGLLTGFLKIQILQVSIQTMVTLPLSLLIMPSFLEELFFRALLLSHKTRNNTVQKQVFLSLFSIFAFIAWHPLNAMTINTAAYPIFTDPVFLLLAALMAFVCTITYLKSGSVWIPVSIHWITVLLWVFFLGGRNVVLD
jgi:predicted Abi (CAAX) family protease